jgi:hypothetical protein
LWNRRVLLLLLLLPLLLLILPSFFSRKEVNLRLWLIWSGLWDIILAAAVRPAHLRFEIPFTKAWALLQRGEDLLAFLSTLKPPIESFIQRSYSAAFLASRAIIRKFTGSHNAAGIQAVVAAQKVFALFCFFT